MARHRIDILPGKVDGLWASHTTAHHSMSFLPSVCRPLEKPAAFAPVSADAKAEVRKPATSATVTTDAKAEGAATAEGVLKALVSYRFFPIRPEICLACFTFLLYDAHILTELRAAKESLQTLAVTVLKPCAPRSKTRLINERQKQTSLPDSLARLLRERRMTCKNGLPA